MDNKLSSANVSLFSKLVPTALLLNYLLSHQPYIPFRTNSVLHLTIISVKRQIKILAIETSCDDTAAAISSNDAILSNVINTQTIHELYGGVVPELASRDHQKKIVPVVQMALAKAAIRLDELDAIACTIAPGLMGSLLVGVSFAKGLAFALNKPFIAVHHLQAHVMASFIGSRKPSFPFLCLTVSGGHTQIVLVEDFLKQTILGQTTDDAAGEAFDKSAKLLGLPYPGGPLIDRYAQLGNPNKFQFPEPKIPHLDFSFSGLKTSILYFIQRGVKENPNFIKDNLNDICASIQERIVTILMNKLEKAALQTGIKEIAIAGGVSANSGLKKLAMRKADEMNWNLFIPEMQYCTDNAAMIAITAYHQFLNEKFSKLDTTPTPS